MVNHPDTLVSTSICLCGACSCQSLGRYSIGVSLYDDALDDLLLIWVEDLCKVLIKLWLLLL